MNTSNQKTKELVRAGHEFAAAMSNDTPIIEIAKLVTRLATALDVQMALVRQLAAENAARRDAIERIAAAYTAGDPAGFEIEHARAIVNVGGDEFLSRLRAEGVDMFAKTMHADSTEADAVEFARQLRGKAGEVQS